MHQHFLFQCLISFKKFLTKKISNDLARIERIIECKKNYIHFYSFDFSKLRFMRLDL